MLQEGRADTKKKKLDLQHEGEIIALREWATKRDADAVRKGERNEWEAKERKLRKEEAARLKKLEKEKTRQAAELAEQQRKIRRSKCDCGATLASMGHMTESEARPIIKRKWS